MTTELIVAVETQRRSNIGTIIRTASAFGASLVVVVGSSQFSTHGAHGAQGHMPVYHFFYWEECIQFLHQRGVKSVFGISPSVITQAASRPRVSTSIEGYKHRFTGSACFIVSRMDRSTRGLTDEEMGICTEVFHVALPAGNEEDIIPNISKIAISLRAYAKSVDLSPSLYAAEKFALGERDHRKTKVIRSTVSMPGPRRLHLDILSVSGRGNSFDEEEEVLGGLFGSIMGEDENVS